MAPRRTRPHARGGQPRMKLTPEQMRIERAYMEQDYPVRRAEYDARGMQRYTMTMKDRLSRVQEPRRGDPDFRQDIRSATITVLDQIDLLEGEQRRLRPDIDPGLEIEFVNLQVKRDLVYWRIFRVNDLPPEILANIFRYVGWSSIHLDLGVKARLWLTSVCRRWRSVAIADFTLWSAIWFRGSLPYERPLTWLDRAGTAPLDLRINERDPRGPENRFTEEQMSWLMDRVLTKLSQIRMLIVIVDTLPPALVVLDKIRHASAAGAQITMERLELHCEGYHMGIGPGQSDTHRGPIPLFNGMEALTLKHISLNGVNIDWTNTPLTNLTTIDIRRIPHDVSPNLASFRNLLRGSPNVHKLALDGAGPVWEERDPSLRPVELPRLAILVLGSFTAQNAMYIMESIYAPNVRDLTLSNMTGEDYTPFIALITPVSKEVRILTLYRFEVAPTPHNAIFARWLQCMPHLGYIRIANIQHHILDAFLYVSYEYDQSPSTSAAPPPPIRHVVCPKLNVIEYQQMDADHIVAFGLKRKALNVPLRKIYVNSPWGLGITPDQEQALSSVCFLFITPMGATTPEEAELMRDGTR